MEFPSSDEGNPTEQSQHQINQNQQEKKLRTSARVSKKLKLDQEANAAALAAANDCKKEEKREDDKDESAASEEKPKVRRAPVLWSPDDKAAFFEALNEHGKNFDAIEKYMLNRAKKRGDHSSLKNRDRARHFYYRTWHKISKHVHFPDSIKKVTQELYALINFGELRKKVGYVTEKNAQKFNELIYSGCTQVRVRGKTWRVKTPVCRALRKLNQFEDDCEEVRLPSRVEVLVSARTNGDSAYVQSLAHNPRVRTNLSLDTTVDSLRDFLQSRWWSPSETGELKVGPRKDAVATQATYRVGQVVTSASVSLLAHESRHGDPERIKTLLSQLQIGKTKSMLKYQQNQPTDQIDLEISDHQPKSPRIGQLYIMYGSKGILELDYWYERNTAEFSLSLQKLLSVAKMYHLKIKMECPCGHVCKNMKPSALPKQKTKKIKIDENFKRPLLPALNTVEPTDNLGLQFFTPKYCNRRGRHRQRSVVVQRMLPLLPKTSPTITVLKSAEIPIIPKPTIEEPKPVPVTPDPNFPSTSNTFKGILGNCDDEIRVTPPASPTSLLKDVDGQWLNSEVTDYSLSSLLGHLESPLKQNGIGNEESHLSMDVDSHFQSLMAESSLDYTAKFADLAAKIVGNASSVQNLPSDPP